MSDPYGPYQTPSPYPPGYAPQYPPGYAQVGAVPSVPGSARAAGVMLGIIGALILSFSALVALVIVFGPTDVLAEQIAAEDIPPEMDLQTFLNVIARCFGICGGITGILYLALAPFAWKGSKAGIIIAIIVVGLTFLLILLNLVVSTVTEGPVALLVNALPAAVIGALLFVLFRALTSLGAHDPYAQAAAWATYHQQQAPPPGWGPQQGWGPPPPQDPDERAR